MRPRLNYLIRDELSISVFPIYDLMGIGCEHLLSFIMYMRYVCLAHKVYICDAKANWPLGIKGITKC